jgi:hypothetical protein
MSNTQIRPFPNIGAVDPRIPSLDPPSADSIRSTDCSARRRISRGRVLRALLWVGRGERGNADGQIRALPNVRAADPGARSVNGPRLEGELGLDRGAAIHALVLSGTLHWSGQGNAPSLSSQALVGLRYTRGLR